MHTVPLAVDSCITALTLLQPTRQAINSIQGAAFTTYNQLPAYMSLSIFQAIDGAIDDYSRYGR